MGNPSDRGLELAKQYGGQVHTLHVDQGNKGPGERVATLVHTGEGRRARAEHLLVFMPSQAPVGKKVRVELSQAVGYDRVGKPLFRGTPADVEHEERWRDNGDETLSLVKVAIDWLLEETEVEVLEMRKAKSREKEPRESSERMVRWGKSLADSVVIETPLKRFPIETETVEDYEIVWKETGERVVPGQPIERPVIEVSASENVSFWSRMKLMVAIPPEQPINLSVKYHCDPPIMLGRTEKTEWSNQYDFQWQELPGWLQSLLQEPYPVCGCGRARINPDETDGYDKCQQCRKDEVCERCGQQPERQPVTLVGSRLVCRDCEPLETMDHMISEKLPKALLEQIAAEALKLQSMQYLDEEAGQALLEATVDHLDLKVVGESWYKRDLAKASLMRSKWERYSHYYFGSQWVWASRFEPAQLMLLALIDQAKGDGLINLITMLVKQPETERDLRVPQRPSFGSQSRSIRGMKFSEEDLDGLVAKLVDLKPVLATVIRGSENHRQTAMMAIREVDRILDSQAWMSKSAILVLRNEAVKAMLVSAQDFSLAIESAEKALELAKKLVLAEKLVAEHFTNCPICGAGFVSGECTQDHQTAWDQVRWSKDRNGDSDVTTLCRLVFETGKVLAEIRIHPGRSVHYYENPRVYAVTFPAESERTRLPENPWDGSALESVSLQVMNLKQPPASLRETELEREIVLLKGQITELEKTRDEVKAAEEAAELTWMERAKELDGSQPIEDGTIIKATFDWGFGPDGEQLQARLFDAPSGQQVVLVWPTWAEQREMPMPPLGQECLVRIQEKSPDQVWLFRRRDVDGYQALLVESEAGLDAQIADLESQVKATEAELAGEQQEGRAVAEWLTDAFTDDGQPNTAMAEAMKKAGLA